MLGLEFCRGFIALGLFGHALACFDGSAFFGLDGIERWDMCAGAWATPY